jgi:hypothetical protein
LGGTTFARDYCVFAPYPLSDAIAPFTESSVSVAEGSTNLAEETISAIADNLSSDSVNTPETRSPCEWIGECEPMGECEPWDSCYVRDINARETCEPTPSIETTEQNDLAPSSQLSQPTEYSQPTAFSPPAEFSQPTELDQQSDRASGAGPEDSAVADGSDLETTPAMDSRENLEVKQRAAVDLQRSVSRILSRNLSALGQSLVRWSEELDQRVRLSEALDASRMDELK